MRFSSALLAVCLSAGVLLLHGCGGGGGTPPARQKRMTVVVMRHCVRSTPWDGVQAVPNHTNVNDYSKTPWPAFSVPEMFCLPRGADIVEGQGRWWKANGGLDLPIRATADLMPGDTGQRDNVTMHRFLKGLGAGANSVVASLDHGPFWPAATAACERARPSTERLLASAERHLRANPPPASYRQWLEALDAAMGRGIAGNWTALNCSIAALPGGLPMPSGSCQAAATFAERMLMEWGGEMDIGWGHMPAHKVPELQLLQTWHFFNWFAPEETYRYFGASMAHAVLSELESAQGGTRLYVGHDSDLMMLKGALGLTWNPSPFPMNATPPGAMLQFVREGDRMSATYFYVGNFSDTSGAMLSASAVFSSTASESIGFAEFRDLLQKGSIPACANGGQPHIGDETSKLVI
mmetsp:Transcript_140134/g.390702  ORF Transcript_140134/g.390702 Transcript_140134/m.390702 type:complete len:408 (+) Transcript_140134:56-1279(+)